MDQLFTLLDPPLSFCLTADWTVREPPNRECLLNDPTAVSDLVFCFSLAKRLARLLIFKIYRVKRGRGPYGWSRIGWFKDSFYGDKASWCIFLVYTLWVESSAATSSGFLLKNTNETISKTTVFQSENSADAVDEAESDCIEPLNATNISNRFSVVPIHSTNRSWSVDRVNDSTVLLMPGCPSRIARILRKRRRISLIKALLWMDEWMDRVLYIDIIKYDWLHACLLQLLTVHDLYDCCE